MTTLVLLLALLIAPAYPYGSTITVTSLTAPSITDFYQDFAYCKCDLTPSLCDNYCCCDGSCPSTTTSSWKTAGSCLTTSSPVEQFCNQTSSKSFGSFSDLSCVYYSNRGAIGSFYSAVQTASLTYPTASKFASQANAGSASSQFTAAAASGTLGSSYSTTNPYLASSTVNYFMVPQPGPGGSCLPGVLNVTSPSTSYQCYVSPTLENCGTLNSLYTGIICLNGGCTSTLGSNIAATTSNATHCIGVATTFSIAYSISSTLAAYNLAMTTPPTATTSDIAFGTTAIVTVTHTVTTLASNSGNPGYQLGKSITIFPSPLSAIASSTGACSVIGAATGTISILFGQAVTYRCQSTNPCSSSFYIDSLLTTSLSIQQYASQSTATVSVVGTGSKTNCAVQRYTLEIVYSYDGWLLDPQYYVVGAQLVTSLSPDLPTSPTSKYLQVSWVFVDPQTVSSPPSNNFYTYFSYLWTPLKQKFGLN